MDRVRRLLGVFLELCAALLAGYGLFLIAPALAYLFAGAVLLLTAWAVS